MILRLSNYISSRMSISVMMWKTQLNSLVTSSTNTSHQGCSEHDQWSHNVEQGQRGSGITYSTVTSINQTPRREARV